MVIRYPEFENVSDPAGVYIPFKACHIISTVICFRGIWVFVLEVQASSIYSQSSFIRTA